MMDRDAVTAPAPVCPRCGSTMTPILYGTFPSGPSVK